MSSRAGNLLESGQQQEPRREAVKFEEFQIPPLGTSPLTGLPESPIWGSINKSSQFSRPSIGDSDSDDEYNFLPMGGHKLQLPGNGSTIATLAASLIWQTEIFYNNAVYIFSMCSNGHLYQTTPAGVTTDVWTTGQHTQNGTLNGTTTVTALSDTSVLSVGMTVTGTDIPANTTVTSIDSGTQIHISNAATGSGTFSLSFSTPLFTTVGTVDIAVWQGSVVIISDSAAQKIYSFDGTKMLIAINSQAVQYITVFQNRLWGAINSTIWWTQINTYNSLAGDSGSYLITDNACSNPINCLMDSPYGLFVSGSNWFKFITNLQDIGIPAVLSFQQNTIEQQIGPLTKWGVLVVGNVIFFANNAGVWAVNGGQPSQISQPFLNGYFSNLDFTKTSLSMAYGMINSVPCIFVQAYYKGDTQVSAGYTVFGYTLQAQQWFRFVDGNVVWISGTVSTAIANNNPTVWGCDGTHIYQMFTNTSVAQTSEWNSKLWSFGSLLDIDNVLNVAVELFVSSTTTVTLSQLNESNTVVQTSATQTVSPNLITIVNNLGQVIQIVNNSLANIFIVGSSTVTYALAQFDGIGRCRRYGVNLSINGIQTALIGFVVSMHRTGAGRGS